MSVQAYDFNSAVVSWGRVPVEDMGYLATSELSKYTHEQLRQLATQAEAARYDTQGWRNWQNAWRDFFGLDSTHDHSVLDFGCGFGLEALQFAKAGNEVYLADINPHSVATADKLLRAHDFYPKQMMQVRGSWPYFILTEPVDIFYASGVLHHTPQMADILRCAFHQLHPNGEARILVYSDRRWLRQIGPLPRIEQDISTHPRFIDWVRACDEVGSYADWYNADKLAYRLQGIGTVKAWAYIGKEQDFLGAIVTSGGIQGAEPDQRTSNRASLERTG